MNYSLGPEQLGKINTLLVQQGLTQAGVTGTDIVHMGNDSILTSVECKNKQLGPFDNQCNFYPKVVVTNIGRVFLRTFNGSTVESIKKFNGMVCARCQHRP